MWCRRDLRWAIKPCLRDAQEHCCERLAVRVLVMPDRLPMPDNVAGSPGREPKTEASGTGTGARLGKVRTPLGFPASSRAPLGCLILAPGLR